MGLYTGISLQQGVEQFNILPETATWLSRCQVQPDYNYIQYINNYDQFYYLILISNK